MHRVSSELIGPCNNQFGLNPQGRLSVLLYQVFGAQVYVGLHGSLSLLHGKNTILNVYFYFNRQVHALLLCYGTCTCTNLVDTVNSFLHRFSNRFTKWRYMHILSDMISITLMFS